MSGNTNIKVIHANLDDDPSGRGIVITGIIDPESLKLLKTDDYQREQLSEKKIRELMEAHRTSRVPTVELGMRGDNVLMRGDVCFLKDPTYIVDGYQRISAGILVMEVPPVATPRIHAVIHLNTDFDWERHRFDDLNLGQTRLSGNVTLRNLRWDIKVMKVLFDMTQRGNFILVDRVSWDQSMKRQHMVTATSFARTAGMLHSHIGPGRYVRGNDLANGLEKIMENTGQRQFVQNIVTFFGLIDNCWGVNNVAYRNAANQLKLTFMLALARMLSDHVDFWEDAKLVIDEQTTKKLASFPINDPSVANLVGSSGKADEVLAIMLAEHVNHGRRTRRITRRTASIIDIEDFRDLDCDELGSDEE